LIQQTQDNKSVGANARLILLLGGARERSVLAINRGSFAVAHIDAQVAIDALKTEKGHL